jgi:hypothetical protein
LSLLISKVAFLVRNWYNSIRYAEVAQQVEQRTENPRVNGPIPFLGTFSCGSSSVVECLLAKEEVASSNLVFRSTCLFEPEWRNRQTRRSQKPLGGNSHVGSTPTFGIIQYDADLCSGSTADFESVCPGSNPGSAASILKLKKPLHCNR